MSNPHHTPRGGLRKSWRDFVSDRGGVAALELSLVALPFFTVLIAMGEIAVMSMTQSNMDFAMAETARRIRTGEIQTAGLSAEDVRQEVCDRANRILAIDCNKLFVEVDEFDAFEDVDLTDPTGGAELQDVAWRYNPGGPSRIVLARSFYEYEVFTPFFQALFGNTPTGERLIVSSIIFRNEPFPEGNT
jgi:Flp pilus assembly protein TadG